MRFSLFQTLVALFVIALSLGLFANHRRLRLQLREYQEEAEKRERFEDKLESALLEALTVGESLDEHPYYKLLVDEVITVADSEAFTFWAELLAEDLGESPPELADCEFHVFRVKGTHDTNDYMVIVRDNRCAKVVWAGGQIGPR